MVGEAMAENREDEPSGREFLQLAVATERVHLRVPSRVDWVERAVMYLVGRAQEVGACDQDRRSKLVTALTEAITNAMVHGNLEISSHLKERGDGSFAQALAERSMDAGFAQRPVDIEMSYDGARCIWTITDQGSGFDVGKVLKRLESDDPEALLASGRGIMLMRAFLDDVSWARGGRQVRLTLAGARAQRRIHDRAVADEPVRAAPVRGGGEVDWDGAFEGLATDMSRGGMSLLKSGLDTAQRLMIELHIDGRPVYVAAEVCHVAVVGDDMARIGCRFQMPEPAGDSQRSQRVLEQHEAIGRILDGLEAPVPRQDERRRHLRRTYTRPLRVMTAGGVDHAAVGRDLSRAGMALVAEVALDAGERVEVMLESKVRLSGTVMRCQRLAGRFHEIGIRFEG